MTTRPPVLLEPFAGGASVSLAAVAAGLVERAELVELDPDVAAVWECLINADDAEAGRLTRMIRQFDMSLPAVQEVIASDPADAAGRAFRTIVMNRARRGGILAPGAGLLQAGEHGRGLTSRWYPQTLVKRIEMVRAMRHRAWAVHRGCGDALHSRGEDA